MDNRLDRVALEWHDTDPVVRSCRAEDAPPVNAVEGEGLRDALGGAERPGGSELGGRGIAAAKVRVPGLLALPRQRLETRLADAFGRRLTLVVAPAGSGKTTLLARFAATCGAPVAWYRAEAWDGDEATFVDHLEAALLPVVPGLRGGWRDIADAISSLDAAGAGLPGGQRTSPTLLVIDDFHTLERTPAEAAFGRLVDQAPAWLTPILGTRVHPALNLSRMRVAGELLEVETDDLRFRAWEVEQLFREVYRDPVPPADLAVLARRTEGWAAGLQLFHLATQGRSAEERRRILGGPGASGRLLREYLAQNVMVGLPAELREFLLATYVLGRLSGPLCDRLLGSSGSGLLLDELARRGLFTVPAEDGSDAYRYHEVLRQHLDRMAVEEIGEKAARARHRAAGELLEDAGAMPEALRAYSRAEDWAAVQRLLGLQGEHLAASGSHHWLEALPPALERHDPWVALAGARLARNDGRFTAALAGFIQAEAAMGPARAAEGPRAERLALAAWIEPGAMVPADGSGLIRSGVTREPVAAAREAARLHHACAPVAEGLLALVAGDLGRARRLLDGAVDEADCSPTALAAARLGSAVAATLAGVPWDGRRFDRAIEEAERGGIGWLARLGRAVVRALGPDGSPEGDLEMSIAGADGRWASALVALLGAWSPQADPASAAAAAQRGGEAFHALGAGTLEAWCAAMVALGEAHLGTGSAAETASAAELGARRLGVPGAQVLAMGAVRRVGGAAGSHSTAVHPPESLLDLPAWARRSADVSAAAAPAIGDTASSPAATQGQPEDRPTIRIRLLGGTRLEVGGRPAILDGAKPRVRSLFRLLALYAGAPVHREVIQEALWPDADGPAGARSLHVALSALRHELDLVAQPFGADLVVREGDAYRLDVAPDDVDLGRFDRAVAAGRAARLRAEEASAAFALALDLYTGELLPEEGPAEWVGERRDTVRSRAIEAAEGLAVEALAAGDHATAIRACRFGLELDRCQDTLWRTLISARERAGEAGAASRDRREYALVLESLGVPGGTTLAAALR